MRFLKLIFKKDYPILPISVLVLFVIVGTFAPFFVLHNPNQVNLDYILTPPFFQKNGISSYPMGTDQLGRDILSRIVLGARVSMIVAASSICLAGIFGVLAGMFAGYFGGTIDVILMRLTDAQLSVPRILLAIVVIGIFGPSLFIVVLMIAITAWPRYARIIRSEAYSLKQEDFISLAKIAGASQFRIIRKHILPNILPSFIVLVTLDIPRMILVEASLSFLGLGVQPPTPSWGGMIAEGRAYMSIAWWLTVMPGFILAITALCANITGDWLRDVLDPSLQD
jgi:peptide/nickel transport system permease protein